MKASIGAGPGHNSMDVQPITSLVRVAGLRATPAILAIVTVLQKTKRPLTTQEIVGALKPKRDTVTVYRILEKLKEKGIVRHVDFQHGHAHYELNSDDHHHIICTVCRKVEDLADCRMDAFAKEVIKKSKQFAALTDHSLEFFGVCKTCARRKK